MRRKQNELVPLELSIIEAATSLQNKGFNEFYGFQIAQELGERDKAYRLIGYGTLYLALHRLQKMGKLKSRWENQSEINETRPRRKYYQIIS